MTRRAAPFLAALFATKEKGKYVVPSSSPDLGCPKVFSQPIRRILTASGQSVALFQEGQLLYRRQGCWRILWISVGHTMAMFF